jgi:hydrogenase maturation factor
MCIAKVGRVLSVRQGKATVKFFDDNVMQEVDVAMVNAAKGSYVEVFANLAISRLSREEAEVRREAWLSVMSALRNER